VHDATFLKVMRFAVYMEMTAVLFSETCTLKPIFKGLHFQGPKLLSL